MFKKDPFDLKFLSQTSPLFEKIITLLRSKQGNYRVGAIMPTPTMPTSTIPTQFLPANNADGSNPDFNIDSNNVKKQTNSIVGNHV
jgi:hypothetical protein